MGVALNKQKQELEQNIPFNRVHHPQLCKLWVI